MGTPASMSVVAAISMVAMNPAMAIHATATATGESANRGMAMFRAWLSASFTAGVSMCPWRLWAMNSVRSGSIAASLLMACRRLSAVALAFSGSAESMVDRCRARQSAPPLVTVRHMRWYSERGPKMSMS